MRFSCTQVTRDRYIGRMDVTSMDALWSHGRDRTDALWSHGRDQHGRTFGRTDVTARMHFWSHGCDQAWM
jgi:hypothetical protein